MTPLLARVGSADRQFERIYQRHAADVYRYALVVLRNPHDAEDVTQTTFLNAYRSMQNGERPESAKNWLIAIAHNVCRQRFRQAQRRPQESELFEEAIVEDRAEPQHTAEDIQRALGQLAFNQRSALVMREMEGRSYTEIAEAMGMSVGAVETVIFRARRALREQLEGSLTCQEAELYLSKQLDGELPRSDRGPLRAHLRQCATCSQIARSQRASRGAFKALLGGLPVPASFLGGGSGLTLGLAAKAAVVVCAGAVVGTGGYEAQRELVPKPAPHAAAKPVASAQAVHAAASAAPSSTPVAAAGLAAPVAERSVPRTAAAAPAHRRGSVEGHRRGGTGDAPAPTPAAEQPASRHEGSSSSASSAGAKAESHRRVQGSQGSESHGSRSHGSRSHGSRSNGARSHGSGRSQAVSHAHASRKGDRAPVENARGHHRAARGGGRPTQTTPTQTTPGTPAQAPGGDQGSSDGHGKSGSAVQDAVQTVVETVAQVAGQSKK